ncbi:hypothetical protein J2X01_000282 [Arthrobacter ginsengisoli]|uniref:Uncharacterized protein n=1 Tax=Arthrobacter ginsengisoli TaxID=1356565 RepID=A0ABU1U748_9MICC|nr:hypothetical protein [Arthrobacter ginsengisoli]
MERARTQVQVRGRSASDATIHDLRNPRADVTTQPLVEERVELLA